jgi:hypothetical protein
MLSRRILNVAGAASCPFEWSDNVERGAQAVVDGAGPTIWQGVQQEIGLGDMCSLFGK